MYHVIYPGVTKQPNQRTNVTDNILTFEMSACVVCAAFASLGHKIVK